MPAINVKSIEQSTIVESDQEFSPYRSVPTIYIPVKVAEARTPTLIDTGASVNAISPRVVGRINLPLLPVCPPVRISQPFHPADILIKETISTRISISSKNLTSEKPTDFLVAPLVNSEAVLKMSFIAHERIKVDTATHDLLLSKRWKTQIIGLSALQYTLKQASHAACW